MKLHLKIALVALAYVVGQTAAVSAAFIDITRPGDPVEVVSGYNQGDGDSGPPPAAEGVEKAIDDTGGKYLNFLDISSGLSVTPSANPNGEPVIGLRLYTANDHDARDPASYQLFGSNAADLASAAGTWEVIASGNLSLPSDRNESSIVIPPTGNLTAALQEVSFDNANPYAHYQLIFPTLKDAANDNSMQIAEVELLVVPEPGSISLVLMGLIGLVARVRSRR